MARAAYSTGTGSEATQAAISQNVARIEFGDHRLHQLGAGAVSGVGLDVIKLAGDVAGSAASDTGRGALVACGKPTLIPKRKKLAGPPTPASYCPSSGYRIGLTFTDQRAVTGCDLEFLSRQ
jgi:hypothetical protein